MGGYALIGLLRERLLHQRSDGDGPSRDGLRRHSPGGNSFARGVRKPYSRCAEVMYSNAVRPDQVEELRKTGWSGQPTLIR